MSITRTSVLDLIGFDVADEGHIQVRVAKLTHEDGRLISREYHRANFHPGTDIDAMLEAVNADLIRQGFTAVDAEGVETIKTNAKIKWTPERLAKHEAKLQAQREEDERLRKEAEAAQAKRKADEDAAFNAAVAAAVERMKK